MESQHSNQTNTMDIPRIQEVTEEHTAEKGELET